MKKTAFTLAMVLLLGLSLIIVVYGKNLTIKRNPSDNITDKAHPLVFAGVLLGGYSNKQWLDENSIFNKIHKEERYRIYSFDSFLGETVGEKTMDRDEKIQIDYPSFAQEGYVAIACPWNAMPRFPKKPDNNRIYQGIIRKVLIDNGMQKDISVNIRQIIKADLEGDGVEEVIIAADNITPPSRAYYWNNEYSVLILRKIVDGTAKNLFLAKDIIVTKKEYEKITPLTYTVKSLIDADGDGILEVLVESEYYEGVSYGLYKVVNNKINKLLEACVGE